MTKYTADAPLQPKGAHNRRLSLGMEPEDLALEAGVTVEQLGDYERTGPDQDYDAEVARLVYAALDRLEQNHPNSQTGRQESGVPNAPVLDEHSHHARLSELDLTSKNLEGAPIYDQHNVEIGKVSHLHGSGAQAQVILDVGGFLGIGVKHVAVDMALFDFMRDENGNVHALTRLSREQLEAMPEHHHHR